MKKLLFVLAFAFIGQQAFPQMYIVIISDIASNHPSNCSSNNYDRVMTTIDPQGNYTYTCMPSGVIISSGGSIQGQINQEFNSILAQGYKLVATDADNKIWDEYNGTLRGAWYFAIP